MRAVLKTTAVTLALLLAYASPAWAEFSISEFTVSSTSSLAGAHPDLTTNIVFPSVPTVPPFQNADGNARRLAVELPPGLIGDPSAVGHCTQSQFIQFECPPDAQIGIARVSLIPSGSSNGGLILPVTLPVFNMEARNPDVTGEIAFAFANLVSIHLPFEVRSSGDYGLTTVDDGIGTNSQLKAVELTTWGVPGDPGHDAQRLNMIPMPITTGPLPVVPFFTNPTACGEPLGFRAEASSYQEPAVDHEARATLPPITGCEGVGFAPTLKARPTTEDADSPSGLEVDLAIPQNEDPAGRAASTLRDATVTLPRGLVVNPSSANGLGACTPAQIGLIPAEGDPVPHFDPEPPGCPASSDLGTVEVETPVFDDPLRGHVFLAAPHDNPFDSLLAIYLTVEGHGLHIKLAGKLDADPVTGQLSTTFAGNPPLPVSHLRLALNPGKFAPLRTPLDCGSYSTTSVLTPWSAPGSGAPATPSDSYAVTHGADGGSCSAPANSPSFEAGSVSPLAGASSPFVLDLKRPDGSQELSSLTVKPPVGLLARLAGVPYCSDAALSTAAAKTGAEEQASPACPAASAVGTVEVAAGAGPSPFNAPGKVYLAGPYKGAPLSLAVITPAVAGPFDLGTVVVRNALFIDPLTTAVTAVSDPIPSILQGIPLDIRSISLTLDRSQFTKNPTSCDPSQVTGTATALTGQSATLAARYQVGGCEALGFSPKLKLDLSAQTRRTGHPAVGAVLTAPEGQANIAATTVILPRSEFIDQAHVNGPCTRVQFAAPECPPSSILGTARAFSPLLDAPLEGLVYFRSNGGERKLPDIVADLNGQIHVTLVGFIDSVKTGKESSRVRTRFLSVPDAPVSRFEIHLHGGKRGLIQNSEDLCTSGPVAKVLMTAHNGKVHDFDQKITTGCGRPKAKNSKPKGSGPKGH